MECKEECFMCAKTGSIKAYSVWEYRILCVLISISSRIGHRSYSASILKGIQGFEGCSLYAYFDNFAI